MLPGIAMSKIVIVWSAIILMLAGCSSENPAHVQPDSEHVAHAGDSISSSQQSDPPSEHSQDEQQDNASVTPPKAGTDAPRTYASTFDPRELKAGDQVAGLVVQKVELMPVTAMNEGFYVDGANISFDGEIQVNGHYEVHPSSDPIVGGTITFHVEEGESFPHMLISDDTSMFRAEAIVLSLDTSIPPDTFGPSGTSGSAELVLHNYAIHFSQSDAYDQAVVKRVSKLRQDKPQVLMPTFTNTGKPEARSYIAQEMSDTFEQIKEMYPQDSEVGLSIATTDLNQDGADDWIAAFHHAYFGHAHNSLLRVYVAQDNGSYTAFPLSSADLLVDEDGVQSDIQIQATPSGEWNDIVVNGVTWYFDGEGYTIQH